MTTWHVTIAGFTTVAAGIAGLELAARRPGSHTPTAGQCLDYLMRTPAGRISIFLSWWWLGWHFFAR